MGFAVCLILGPTALLQLGAWSWMVASYAPQSSLPQAIVETFGDERPCHLCRAIDAVEDARSGDEPTLHTGRDLLLMLGLARAITGDTPRGFTRLGGGAASPFGSLALPVPTPPPRAAGA
jgi:hypothetical protein